MDKLTAISQAMGRAKTNLTRLSERTNISRPTLSKKLHRPNLFTLGEIGRIDKELHFTEEEQKVLIKGE